MSGNVCWVNPTAERREFRGGRFGVALMGVASSLRWWSGCVLCLFFVLSWYFLYVCFVCMSYVIPFVAVLPWPSIVAYY